MSYDNHHKFFAQAYRTGSDEWTIIPFKRKAHELTLYLPKGSLILDLGTGRARLLFELAELGFRVIGLEFNAGLVKRANNIIKDKKLEHNLRALEGNALDIPLTDQSFDAVVDVGLMQHIKPADYKTFVSEAARVLKQGGFFFLVVLSMKTENHHAWHPSKEEKSDYHLEGLDYHFFSDGELRSLLEKDFDIKHFDYDMPYGPDRTIYSVLLMRKK